MPWTPGTWGPPFWKTIHITALYIDYLFTSNPQEALQRWDKFLHGITNGLPCIQCETHFRSYQKEHPPPRSSQGFDNPQFLRWTIQAHNDVRARNNKIMPKEEDVVKAYLDGRVFQMSSSPHNMLLTKTLSFDACTQLEDQLIGWKIGFGIACFVACVFIIALFLFMNKRSKKKR
jgi:hypothetical protein